MKFVADGKNNMKISAVKRLPSTALKPYLGLRGSTLRAAAVLAGVVHPHLIITVRAGIYMVPLLWCTARHYAPCRMKLPPAQSFPPAVFIEMIVENRLNYP